MAAVPILQRPTAKDDTIMYGAGYALVTVLFIWLGFNNVPIKHPFDILAQGVCSLGLLFACVILLAFLLDALGRTMLPDDHDKGTFQTFIGAMVSMHIAIIVAVFTHWLDGKTLPFQIFWIQILALPGAYTTARFLGKTINGKEQWLWRNGTYRLVNLMIWLNLQNVPGPKEEDPFLIVGWVFSLFILVLLDIFYLIESIVHNFEFKVAQNPQARNLVVIGIFIGVGMVVGVMVPLKLNFHVLEGKHWAYQILIAELGALPGAHLIGGSKWLAKIYAGRQPTSSGYSKISTEESQV
jgi:hypothetical protein